MLKTPRIPIEIVIIKINTNLILSFLLPTLLMIAAVRLLISDESKYIETYSSIIARKLLLFVPLLE